MLKLEIKMDEEKIRAERNIVWKVFTRHYSRPFPNINSTRCRMLTGRCLLQEMVIQRITALLVILSLLCVKRHGLWTM